MKRLGIIVNVQRPDAETTVQAIERWAKAHQWPIVACERINIAHPPDFVLVPKEVFADRIDLLLALGGDGTILTAARTVAEFGIPVLGINLGSLGFLTVVPPAGAIESFERINRGDYRTEERLMLKVSESGGTESWAGLNDIVLDKGGIARIVTFHVRLNGEFVSEIAGDGLIVATPTGSTAYALSVGGPILTPTMQAFVLAPISPHTLAQRPMVLAAEDRLQITVKSVAGSVMLTIDGQWTRRLEQGATVEITRSEHPARLINFPERSFMRVLREKLHWGMGPGGISE
ncbi:MAG: NAD(+)/NADH kinase [candidate division Zixibacteria bacterium]|nr:NAD(+)/NADH kinase [candidate division Zixibacteria bacterium]